MVVSTFVKAAVECTLLTTILAFSVNYIVNEDDLTVEDPNGALKIYEDKNSDSGNVVKVNRCPSRSTIVCSNKKLTSK